MNNLYEMINKSQEESIKNLDESLKILNNIGKNKDYANTCPKCGEKVGWGIYYDKDGNDYEGELGHDEDCPKGGL